MLNIEVNEETQHGHTSYFHSVVVEDDITPDAADTLNACIEAHPEVTMNLTRVRPGDDIYGTVADYHQFLFWATRDITGWLETMAAALFSGETAFADFAREFLGEE